MIQDEATGYLHPLYAQSLDEFGTPRLLWESGGWILERQIPASPYNDAMGCYPLFTCRDWSRLHVDLESLGESLVCLSVVTDPFGEYDPAYLKDCFRDIAVPFKEHFVVDLTRSPETFVHPHHRRNLRKALNLVQVEECAQLETCLKDWTTLYTELEARHHITGIAAFSKESFAGQWRVPGLIAFRAVLDGGTVGMLMWYRQGNRAYYHLGAHSALGYETGASFALFDYSLDYFARQGLEWLDLGAGAGTKADMKSGLNRFKRGWATGTRTAYFCGRILDPERYAAETKRSGQTSSCGYFPAYRKGEFG